MENRKILPVIDLQGVPQHNHESFRIFGMAHAVSGVNGAMWRGVIHEPNGLLSRLDIFFIFVHALGKSAY